MVAVVLQDVVVGRVCACPVQHYIPNINPGELQQRNTHTLRTCFEFDVVIADECSVEPNRAAQTLYNPTELHHAVFILIRSPVFSVGLAFEVYIA